MYLISLSAIPTRFHLLEPVLNTLLAQTTKPEEVRLYIPNAFRRFPDWDGRLPDVPRGVRIVRCDEDDGPATKVLPALRDLAGQQIDVLFCDDDHLYPRRMGERFLTARRDHPQACLANSGLEVGEFLGVARHFEHLPRRVRRWRATDLRFQAGYAIEQGLAWLGGRAAVEPARRSVKRAGYADCFEGYGGVMIRPDFLPSEAFDVPDFARTVDDIWLSGHALRVGHPTWVLGGLLDPQRTASHTEGDALHLNVFNGIDRDDTDERVMRYFRDTYGIWS